MDYCRQCVYPIHQNDDAGVCIECGGRNTRLKHSEQETLPRVILALMGAATLAMVLLALLPRQGF